MLRPHTVWVKYRDWPITTHRARIDETTPPRSPLLPYIPSLRHRFYVTTCLSTSSTYRGTVKAIAMNLAFIPSVPLTAGSRPLSPRSLPFSFRPAQTTPRHGLFQQSTDAHAPCVVPVASLSRSLSVLASLLSLGLFPADVATASSALPNSRPQHIEAAVQLSSSSSTASNINNDRRSIHSPVTLIAPVRAAETSSTSNANKSVANKEIAKAPAAVTVQQRCSFYLSEFLMWHPGAKVLSLLAFTLAVMYFGSFLYQIADPNQEEAPYPFWYVSFIHQHSFTYSFLLLRDINEMIWF